jgi:hypothetical protein
MSIFQHNFYQTGIGNFDSDCMMVKYQAEIEKFRQTYRDTMALVPER